MCRLYEGLGVHLVKKKNINNDISPVDYCSEEEEEEEKNILSILL